MPDLSSKFAEHWGDILWIIFGFLILVLGRGAKKALTDAAKRFWEGLFRRLGRAFGFGQSTKSGPTLPQLRDAVDDFAGRSDQIKQLVARLKRGKGAAISGQAGVGKTELAYYVVRKVRNRYRDGQVWVDLRGLHDQPLASEEAMRDVLTALEPEQKLPEKPEQISARYQGLLAERRVLILADNVRDSEQVRLLKPKSPSALLVTSRQPIQVEDIEAVDLNQLRPAEAEGLLGKIVGKGRADKMQIARLAELCGYLPLAARVAGDRLRASKSLSAVIYIEKLEQDRGELRFQSREVMAVLAESVEALERDQPELVEKWRSLGVFPAPFLDVSGEAVGELEGEQLEDLVGRSLVLYDTKEKRFRLHDLFRELARGGLSEAAEYAAAKRHAEHFLRVATVSNDRFVQGKEGVLEGLRVFDRERVQIEAGQTWAAGHAERNDGAAAAAQGYPLRAAQILSLRQHARDRIAWLETSVRAALKLENRQAEGEALGNLGVAYRDLGETRKAIEYYKRALAIVRETGSRRGEGMMLGNLGVAYGVLGETRKAIEYFEQDLAIARETGDRRGEGTTLGNLGNAYSDLGETRKAIEHYEQHLAGTRETGDRRGEGDALNNRALSLDELGRREEGIADARAALAIREETEDPNAEKTRQLLADWGALPDD